MSGSALVPGSRSGITRHLGHLKPPAKGSKWKVAPNKVFHTPNFVQPHDRIAFWNIVPGDEVRLRAGRVGQDLGFDQREKMRGEGKVLSVDKTRNLAWLVDLDEANPRAPKSIKHVIPRLVDPDDPSKGYSSNTIEVARPVHYSNLMLRLPEVQGEKTPGPRYAVRLERKNAYFSRRLRRWVWQRFAVVRNDDGTTSRIHVPWPAAPYYANEARPDTAGKDQVKEESWLPWSPMDPVHLTPERPWSSRQSEEDVVVRRAELSRAAQEAARAKKAQEAGQQRRLGMYAGFAAKSRPKMPPVPQPPTASELLSYSRESLAEWASDPAVRQHISGGGRSFAPDDYLDFAPPMGPGAGGDWTLPLDPQGFQMAAFRRDAKSGKLVGAAEGSSSGIAAARALSKAHFDSMPVELLMTAELTNPRGIKVRRRRREQEQALAAMEAVQTGEDDKEAVEQLRAYMKGKMVMDESAKLQAAGEALAAATVTDTAAAATSAESAEATGPETAVSEEIATQAEPDAVETDAATKS
ncbi:unnamed protein product [Parajaminaea phylloscopi]